METMKYTCQECGCICESCVNNNSLHLHREIESLKRQLMEKDYHIVKMETSVLNHAQQYPNGEEEALREELRFWQEKYDRLYESYKKLQKVNQSLEDKLLRIVDKFETEKSALTRDVADLTSKLVDARLSITELEEENEQYRNDCNVAVQLLQCKPSNFVASKYSTLPGDLQEKVRMHLTRTNSRKDSNTSKNEVKTIRVPISTFPPTAMVYSVSKVPVSPEQNGSTQQQSSNSPPDYISAAIMAKVLEERAQERNNKGFGHCRSNVPCESRGVQVNLGYGMCSCSNGQVVCVHASRHRSESSSSSDSFVARPSQSTETII